MTPEIAGEMIFSLLFMGALCLIILAMERTWADRTKTAKKLAVAAIIVCTIMIVFLVGKTIFAEIVKRNSE